MRKRVSGEVKKNRWEVRSLISGKTHKQKPHILQQGKIPAHWWPTT